MGSVNADPWGIYTPDASCLPAGGKQLGGSHWYTVAGHPFFLGNVKPSRPTKQTNGLLNNILAFRYMHMCRYMCMYMHMFVHNCPLQRLRTHGAPVRYTLSEGRRDSQSNETARATCYVAAYTRLLSPFCDGS